MEIPKEYVIVDTEYTAWKGSMSRNWSKKGEHRELVQIAALKIANNILIDSLNILVKPLYNPILSKYFVDLTGITNQELHIYGSTLEDSLYSLYKFTNGLFIYSYGNDYSIIYENLKLNKINKSTYFDWSNMWIDIRLYFQSHKIDTDKYTSGTIYKITGKKYNDNRVHNALWDCKSIYLAIKYLNIRDLQK